VPKQDEIDEFDPENVPNIEKINFTDMISFEDSSKPILLLNPKDFIDTFWKQKNSNLYNKILICPLFLLNNIGNKDMIGRIYDVLTFKKLESNADGLKKDPYTGIDVFGGIIPHASMNDSNDYVISASFYSKKILNKSFVLLYYVIYKLAESCEWLKDDHKETLLIFKEYAMERIKNSYTNITFTNLPHDPKLLVPTLISCYFVTEISSLIFSQTHLYKLESLKLFHSVSDYFQDILKYWKYDIDEIYIKERSEKIKHINRLKRIPKHADKLYYILNLVLEKQNNFLITKVNPDKFYLLNYIFKFNYDILTKNIKNTIDTSNLNEYSDFIPDILPNNTLESFKSSILISYYHDLKQINFKICPKTFRPYYNIDNNNNFYYNLKKYTYNVTIKENIFVKDSHSLLELQNINNNITDIEYIKLLSLCDQYIKFVTYKKQYPTLDEFENFVHDKNKMYKNKIRIFAGDILQAIKLIFDMYSVFNNISIENFIKISKESVPIDKKIELENSSKN
jgi:hypothetical protein